ncbi:MAG: C-terminal binding protein [Lachnospiraceae bacterium]|nr:C-terminal binding protein [Lachnospiraceae bacterium]
MIVLASDYKDQLINSYEVTKQAVIEGFCSGKSEIAEESDSNIRFYVEPYGTPRFWDILREADGLITAFINVDDAFLEKAPKLKMISVNATGYNSLDLDALKRHGVAMSHITSYCTREVSEHAITMMLALNKNLPQYADEILVQKKWKYMDLPPRRTVDHLTVTIFGFGQIGRMTAKLANAIGAKVQAVDPYVKEEVAKELNVTMVSPEEALESSDVVINHMILNESTSNYFDKDFFQGLKRQSIFINVGRGGSVDEGALLDALKKGLICSAGLDVLADEDPDIEKCPFAGMSNVILTPHSAFYSEDSNRALEEISGRSMGMFLAGNIADIQGFIG